ncbi:MAG: twin-arginine translocation signal domain-containing protein [Terracidiphilus sp.]
MPLDRLTRRTFLARSAALSIAAGSGLKFWTPAARAAMPLPTVSGPADEHLDGYVAAYMTAMKAPGLTLGLAEATQTVRIAGYGLADVDRRVAVGGDHLSNRIDHQIVCGAGAAADARRRLL